MTRRLVVFSVFLLVLMSVASTVFAWSWNPLDWVKTAAESGVKSVLGAAFGALILWLGKGKWDSIQLKRAVAEIKGAVDEVRKANDVNSPGGNKVTIGEATKVAERSLSAILYTLRGINPKWLPHWVE